MGERKKEVGLHGLEDPKRAAYMIAWRDRHIKKQEELLRGYEEQSTLMEALLVFALLQASTQTQKGFELRIPKAELRDVLERYACEVACGDEEYVIRFFEKRERNDDGEQKKE